MEEALYEITPMRPVRAPDPQGTIVDATMIHEPGSIKNEDERRDPEVHQAVPTQRSPPKAPGFATNIRSKPLFFMEF
ncbi:hypothetical protein D3C84_1109890 [compost metagenome]